MVTARMARATWTRVMGVTYESLVKLARRLRLVVTERVERIDAMKEALDRRARDHLVRRRQQHRLPQLLVPRANADREALVAVEAIAAEDEVALFGEIGRSGAQ